jgi:hypothetical protein
MSQRTVREPRSHYNGAAEVWAGGIKRFDATVQLTGYVDVTEITTFGGKEVLDGVTSWDGHFVGANQNDLFGLTGENFDLKLTNGQTGGAVLLSGTHIQGVRETPFD